MSIIFSFACAIELSGTVVVTGGYDTVLTFDFLTTVQVYDTFGPKEQLPDLLTPRAFHACAHYVDSDDRVVSLAPLCRHINQGNRCYFFQRRILLWGFFHTS